MSRCCVSCPRPPRRRGPCRGSVAFPPMEFASGGHISFCATKRNMEKKKRLGNLPNGPRDPSSRPRRGLRAPPLDPPRGLRGFYEGRGQFRLNTSAFGRLASYIATLIPLRKAPVLHPRKEDPMGKLPRGFPIGRRGGLPKGTAYPVHDRPEASNFGAKRRSNRTHASIRGAQGNRACAAREICDDEAAGSP